MLLEKLTIITNIAVLSTVGYVIFSYLKFKNKLYKMNDEELLQDIDLQTSDIEDDKQETKREDYQPLLLVVVVSNILVKTYNSQTLTK